MARETSTRLKRTAQKIHASVPELANVECVFGKSGLAAFKGKRCIVWVTPGGNVGPAQRTNGQITNEAGKPERISIVANRVEDVQASIFAENDEVAEAILDALCAGIHKTLGPNAPYPWPYGWAGDSQDAGGAVNKMPMVMLKFTALMPVSEQALGLRAIEHFRHGHSEASEPPHTEPSGP